MPLTDREIVLLRMLYNLTYGHKYPEHDVALIGTDASSNAIWLEKEGYVKIMPYALKIPASCVQGKCIQLTLKGLYWAFVDRKNKANG